MKNKILSLIFSVLFIIPSIFLFSACGKEETSQINFRVDFRIEGEYIQWTEDGKTWTNLIELEDIKGQQGIQGEQGPQGLQGIQGVAGKQVEFQKTDTHIQWRYVGDVNWTNLVALEDIKGENGDDGEDASVNVYKVALNFTTPSYWKETALTEAFDFSDLILNDGIVENYNSYFELEEGYIYNSSSDTFNYNIQSNEWLGDKLPNFENTKFADYFLGWFIEGTDIEINQYSFIGGNVTLKCKWDEDNMRKYLHEGVSFGPTNENGISVRISSPYFTSKLEPKFIIIPEYYKGSDGDILVTRIEEIKYENPENVLNVVIPNTITTIGEKAFYKCSKLGFYYGDFNIGKNITQIGSSAFECSSVNNVYFNSSTLTIGENAFKDCVSLRKICLPNGVTSIGENAFSGCTKLKTIGLESEYISNAITSSDAFGGLFIYAEVIYVTSDLDVSNSTYLLENFTMQEAESGIAYDYKYVKNAE